MKRTSAAAWPLLFCLLVAAAGLGLMVSGCGAPPNSVDVSAYPPDMQARYDLFEKRCTRCHELERPLNAHVGDGGWQKYVRRMARHPAAGIPDDEQREIARFLEFYSKRRRESASASLEEAGGAP